MGHDHPTAVKDKILHGLEQLVRRGSNSITLWFFFFLFFFSPGPGNRWLCGWIYCSMTGLPYWRFMEFPNKKLREDWARPVEGRSPPWPIDSVVYNLHTIMYTVYNIRVSTRQVPFKHTPNQHERMWRTGEHHASEIRNKTKKKVRLPGLERVFGNFYFTLTSRGLYPQG